MQVGKLLKAEYTLDGKHYQCNLAPFTTLLNAFKLLKDLITAKREKHSSLSWQSINDDDYEIFNDMLPGSQH